MKANSLSAGIYGMGFIGHATMFWLGVLDVFKAIFWPAVLARPAVCGGRPTGR